MSTGETASESSLQHLNHYVEHWDGEDTHGLSDTIYELLPLVVREDAEATRRFDELSRRNQQAITTLSAVPAPPMEDDAAAVRDWAIKARFAIDLALRFARPSPRGGRSPSGVSRQAVTVRCGLRSLSV